MSQKLRWGILGTGMIARKFAADLPDSDTGSLAAVGSRTVASAAAFAAEHGGTPHGSYQALVDDADVQAVYISLPNQLHKEWTLRSLAAGKHVLCEKPFALNQAESREMFDAAKTAGLVLIEAFMYRAHPVITHLLRELHSGVIGELRLIRSNFSFCREASTDDGRYHEDWGGGGIMDVGCYCINLARTVTGAEPLEVRGMIHRHELGVDDYAAAVLRFPGDVLCTMTCGMTVFSDWTTYLCGTKGWIEIDTPWLGAGNQFTVVTGENEDRRTVEVEEIRPLYAIEADRFAHAVGGGDPWITRDDTLGNMAVLDELRRQAGLAV